MHSARQLRASARVDIRLRRRVLEVIPRCVVRFPDVKCAIIDPEGHTVRFVIVSNWVNFLFTAIAAAASFVALSRRTLAITSVADIESPSAEKIQSEATPEKA